MSLSTRLRRPQQSDDPSSSSSPPPSSFYSKVDKQGSLSNYWEPLHFLLYKSGFQTWEYSSQFALRSYLYILFHELVGRPASWLFAEEKLRVFYAVRIFLALLSVITDTVLRVGLSSLAFLELIIPRMSVDDIIFQVSCQAHSLSRRFKQAFLAGAAISVALLVSSVLVDHYYYSGWTSSLLNLLIYNVAGGGESHLYGTEGPLYYLRNGFNNSNFCFVLALLFLAMVPIARKKYAPNLLIVVSPVYIWLAFMSLQPHKEERFLYPIYPLICVAASAVIESFPDVFRFDYDSQGNSPTVMTAKILRPVVLSLILCASHARTFSVINGYSAPIEVYKLLEDHDDVGTGSILCVGNEWHRFPSSFFVPDYVGEVRWIDDGFRGLLPFPFNSTLGGTAAAPPYLNSKNKASDLQYLRDLDQCTFLVELQLSRPFPSRGSDLSTWEVIGALPYLDRELSPAKYRSFFIPYLWQHKNIFGMYKLHRRVPK
ncbi:dol-P-Man:Man(6)GlcNAc(2)-PP-Dol alpha-1,2-mannosyltransferase-like isoform X3 [Pyrus x bretschneideri]|uniref:dol-P-Man:Man(6)GlcNAc(2)-PP-Dol alpha-1,2-mannosyltransferase-like isoform X3 n=1 Tax=Pyrus x bretschneideri TaxID=225117 RepID=UPI0020306F72|nr:dol-P-Man:Man(6)GlcNAc(2)-PP-Dol alpha-1,2-mannosyltransferase-like isoform X3 [Pyrus x bretschneideri]